MTDTWVNDEADSVGRAGVSLGTPAWMERIHQNTTLKKQSQEKPVRENGVVTAACLTRP